MIEIKDEYYTVCLHNANIFNNLLLFPEKIDFVITDPPYNKNLSRFEKSRNRTTEEDMSWDQINYNKWLEMSIYIYNQMTDGGHFIFFGDTGEIAHFIANTHNRFMLKTVGQWEKGNAMFFAQNACGFLVERALRGKDEIKYLHNNGEKSEYPARWGFSPLLQIQRNKIVLTTPEALYWENFISNPVTSWESIAFFKKQESPVGKTLLDNQIGGYRKGKLRDASPVFYEKTTSSENHLTPKPLKLMEKLLEYVIPYDCPFNKDRVYTLIDPFMGSGTTIVAAMNIASVFKVKMEIIGVELIKETFNIAVNRIEKTKKYRNNPLEFTLE